MKTWISLGVSVGVISLFMACTVEEVETLPGTGGGTTSTSSSSSTSTSSSSTSTSSSTSSSSSSSGGCGDFVYSTDATCQGCMLTNCCSQLAACATGTPCEQLFTCLEPCANDDQACIDACFAAHGAGQPAAMALIQCGDGACAEDCGGGGICDSGMGYESEVLNQCLTDNCCTDFDACNADIDCNACLLNPDAPGCDTNQYWIDYQACFDTNCPTDMCGSGIGLYAGGVDPIFECNICIDNAATSGDPSITCCSLMETCLGPDTQNPDVDLCIACLNGDAANCTDTAAAAAAATFVDECMTGTGTCAAECS